MPIHESTGSSPSPLRSSGHRRADDRGESGAFSPVSSVRCQSSDGAKTTCSRLISLLHGLVAQLARKCVAKPTRATLNCSPIMQRCCRWSFMRWYQPATSAQEGGESKVSSRLANHSCSVFDVLYKTLTAKNKPGRRDSRFHGIRVSFTDEVRLRHFSSGGRMRQSHGRDLDPSFS